MTRGCPINSRRLFRQLRHLLTALAWWAAASQRAASSLLLLRAWRLLGQLDVYLRADQAL